MIQTAINVVSLPVPTRAPLAIIHKTFFGNGTEFSAEREAEGYLSQHGFSIAPSCAASPRGILYGDWQIAKWRNLTRTEILQLHGTLTGSGRTGPLHLKIFEHAPVFAIARCAGPSYVTDPLKRFHT
ncbi:MAG: hypothetical protein V4673_14330 [Pseudomonadota bacterium]